MEKKSKTVLGIVIMAELVTGFAGLLVALFAFFSAEWVGASLCLGAAALAFAQEGAHLALVARREDQLRLVPDSRRSSREIPGCGFGGR